jgi:hypothetical protein
MPFFFKEQEEKKKKWEEEQKKKKRYKRGVGTKKTRTEKPSSRTSKDPHPSSLFFSSSNTGDIVQSITYITEKGIRLGIIYESKGEGYEVKLLDSKYNVVIEKSFTTLDGCKEYLASRIENEGEINPESGLSVCVRDLLTRLKLIENEYMFLFDLLTNPHKRKEYELKPLSKEPITLQKKTNKDKKDVLNNLGKDVRSKIKGLKGMKK